MFCAWTPLVGIVRRSHRAVATVRRLVTRSPAPVAAAVTRAVVPRSARLALACFAGAMPMLPATSGPHPADVAAVVQAATPPGSEPGVPGFASGIGGGLGGISAFASSAAPLDRHGPPVPLTFAALPWDPVTLAPMSLPFEPAPAPALTPMVATAVAVDEPAMLPVLATALAALAILGLRARRSAAAGFG